MNVRLILGLALLALLGWFLVAVFGGGSGPDEASAAVRSFRSSEQCRACHARVFAEWEGSSHAIAWVNERVRFLSNDFANQDCIDCHAPKPVFEVGVAARPLPRETRRVEGVDCITCHALPGGGVAGLKDDSRAACRPVKREELGSVEFCTGCHNQHKTVDEWRASEWPARGEDCVSCHMPARGGDPAAGHDHTMPGGLLLSELQKAVTLEGERDGDGWVAVVSNVGAGHAFPTDERSRAADLFWRPLHAEGDAARWTHFHRIRAPYRTETDLPRTLLDAGEVRRVPIPGAKGPIEVALFYKRSPFYHDPDHWNPDDEDDITLVRRVELVP